MWALLNESALHCLDFTEPEYVALVDPRAGAFRFFTCSLFFFVGVSLCGPSFVCCSRLYRLSFVCFAVSRQCAVSTFVVRCWCAISAFTGAPVFWALSLCEVFFNACDFLSYLRMSRTNSSWALVSCWVMSLLCVVSFNMLFTPLETSFHIRLSD